MHTTVVQSVSLQHSVKATTLGTSPASMYSVCGTGMHLALKMCQHWRYDAIIEAHNNKL